MFKYAEQFGISKEHTFLFDKFLSGGSVGIFSEHGHLTAIAGKHGSHGKIGHIQSQGIECRIWNTAAVLLTIDIHILNNNAMDLVVAWKKLFITHLITNHHEQQQAGCKSYRQSENIQQRKRFMPCNIPERYLKIIPDHLS